MSLRLSLVASALALLAAACDEGPERTTSDRAPGWVQIHELYVQPTCAADACHGGERGVAGLSLDDPSRAYDMLVDAAPTNGAAQRDGLARVAPGDLERSLLWWKLTEDEAVLEEHGYGAGMPFGGANAPGPRTEAALRAWIEDGAPYDGLTFEPDFVDRGDTYVDCDATDEEGLRACFGENPDPERYLRLYSPPITIPAGTERIVCSFLPYAPEEDLLFRATRGKQMRGGHHIAVFYSSVWSDDALPHECTDEEMVNLQFAAGAGGAGGQDTDMPEGVGLRVGAGFQVVLQSHYINTSDEDITVMDMVDIERTTAEESPTIVDSFAMIDSKFEVPARTSGYTRVKECRVDEPMDIYLLLGHTHDFGVLFDFEIERAGEEPELLYHATDGPLLRDNPEIRYYDTPLRLAEGDVLRMTCAWDNPTEGVLGWPEEMCVALMYYGPGRGWLTCGTDDETPQTREDEVGCAMPTDEGNELGVGKFCTEGGNECQGLDADFCPVGFDGRANYCTIIFCDTDEECGSGATCVAGDSGSACVPDHC